MRARLSGFRPTYASVMATLALIVALGGTSYAALKLPADSVTTVQVKNGSLLKRDFKVGQLPAGAKGAKGERGARGARGDTGSAGAAGGARVYGQVTAAGALDPTVANNGFSVVSHPVTGWYCLSFDAGTDVTTTSVIFVFNDPIEPAQYPIERRWASTPICPANTLGIITYADGASFTATDRNFQILIP